MGEEPDAMRPVDPRASATPSDDDPAVIRAEIEETRAEMAETIDAIQDKLSPQRIVDPCGKPARKIGLGSRVVQKNPVRRISRMVCECRRSWLVQSAGVDHPNVGSRKATPRRGAIQVCRCLHLNSDRFEGPGNLMQQRNLLRNDNNLQRPRLVRHTSSASRIAGLEGLVHSQP